MKHFTSKEKGKDFGKTQFFTDFSYFSKGLKTYQLAWLKNWGCPATRLVMPEN